MERIPNLDWPIDLFSEDMADQLMIEFRENGFWEQGDSLAFIGSPSLVPAIADKQVPPLLLLVATLDNTASFADGCCRGRKP